MLSGMHSTQIAVRIPDELLAAHDDAIPGRFATRADAVRVAVAQLLLSEGESDREARHRQAWIDQPATTQDELRAIEDSRALIAEEPW